MFDQGWGNRNSTTELHHTGYELWDSLPQIAHTFRRQFLKVVMCLWDFFILIMCVIYYSYSTQIVKNATIEDQ